MNVISEYLVSHMVAVYFAYGLAFFTLGVALLISKRRSSAFRFAAATTALALFGLLHGAHEWVEMFQLIAAGSGYTPLLWHEIARILLLALSFLLLLGFALTLLGVQDRTSTRVYAGMSAALLLWVAATWAAAAYYGTGAQGTAALADVLVRYIVGIPAALLAAWALMSQQRIFRDSDIPEFGASLVWCAAALVLYALVGQPFVRPTPLPLSPVLNSANFLDRFGIPVQLFRAIMAAILTVFMLRVLGVFEVEERRRLHASNEARLAAQAATLDAVQTSSQRLETVNLELKLAMRKLSMLVDISNTLQERAAWPEPLLAALSQIVDTLTFADAGLILLAEPNDSCAWVAAAIGYPQTDSIHLGGDMPDQAVAVSLGEECLLDGMLHCLHADGDELRISLEDVLLQQECRRHMSPTLHVALPLMSAERTIGAIALSESPTSPSRLSSADLALMVGIAQELGRSVENALLHRQALEREQMLAELLGKVVNAEEGERQRIARELHDATGQSLTAIGLALRGIQTQVENEGGEDAHPLLAQLDEVLSYSNGAMRELQAIIADLRPPHLDELGLEAAVHWYARTFQKRWNMPVHVEASGPTADLSSEYSTVLFRILQEALSNVARHAGATRVDITLQRSDQEIRLLIHDNGRGFQLVQGALPVDRSSGWGLAGMRERVSLVRGVMHVETSAQNGTAIEVQIPLAMKPEPTASVADSP